MADSEIPVSSGPPEPCHEELDAQEDPAVDLQESRQHSARHAWNRITGVMHTHAHVRDWISAVFTGALVIATIYYVHYAGQQRNAMLDAVKESRRANDLAEQALSEAQQTRLSAEGMAQENLGIAKQSMVAQLRAWVNFSLLQADQAKRTIKVEFTNNGRSVARDIGFHFRTVDGQGRSVQAGDFTLPQLSPGSYSSDIIIDLPRFKESEPMSLNFMAEYWNGFERTTDGESSYRYKPGKGWSIISSPLKKVGSKKKR